MYINYVPLAIPIILAPLIFMGTFNYFMCAFMDPGFMPRATADEALDTEKKNGITVDLSGNYYPTPKNVPITVSDVEYELKFCVIFFISNNIRLSIYIKLILFDSRLVDFIDHLVQFIVVSVICVLVNIILIHHIHNFIYRISNDN